MSSEPFQVLDIQTAGARLEHLHEHVIRCTGRIEITRDGSTAACVLISKAELESLEQAIEILSQNGDYKALCDHITGVVNACGQVIPARNE